MSEMNSPANADALSQKQRIALVLREMQAKIDHLEEARHEPIAIIGMGCRFPGGAATPADFWRLIADGGDAVGPVPADRWADQDWYSPDASVPRTSYAREGGFLSGPVDTFDAGFFGIAPREARHIDPQHRLILEVAWEALERAGIVPASLVGSQSGVFIGIIQSDYAALQLQSADNPFGDPYFMTGTDTSFAAGRLSYLLGLQGPCIPVNTACSSSLVAIHLACQNLRLRTCDLALAGGVNVILSPNGFIGNSGLQALAPDGRCKSFDAGADGFGRGEGAGVLVLKRLADAQAAGDPILAVVHGTAINHDGPSGGLTVPSGAAQERLLRAALADARLTAADVAYVEAHGTGTVLGDPIEAQALNAVYGQDRPLERPLLIGSVKSNIGHLEAAAGVAGVIKLVLALQHRVIPPSLHFQNPNPYIDWSGMPLRVAAAATPWPAQERLSAGVSSFGLSGMNAHLILGAAPPSAGDRPAAARPLAILKVSAKDPVGLQAQARAAAAHLSASGADLADLCYTANAARSDFAHRMVAIGASAADLAEQLTAPEGAAGAAIRAYAAESDRPAIVFAFTGQGAQYAGMAQELYAEQPIFRAAIERCAAVLDPLLGRPLQDVLFPGDGHSLVNQTRYTQPAMFALEYALVELWRSWGVVPDVVFGHSVGEYVAATVAGVIGLNDALMLIAARGRMMQELPATGAMAAIFGDPGRVIAAVAPHSQSVSVAAFNEPQQTVISGDQALVAQLSAQFAEDGMRVQPLTVSHAFHSPLLRPMLERYRQLAAGITYREPQIPLISNLTGRWADSQIATAEYWCQHVLAPVRFADSVRFLQSQAAQRQVVLEIGPHPTLLGLIEKGWDGPAPVLLSSLRRNQPDAQSMLQSLARLYLAGAAINWQAVERPYHGQVDPGWPTYAFQREVAWIDSGPARQPRPALEDWLYALEWQLAAGQPQLPAAATRWLIFDDRAGTGAALAAELTALGATAELVPATAGEQPDRLLDGAAPFDWVVDARALDIQADQAEPFQDQRDPTGCVRAVELIQAMLRQPDAGPRLWLLTRGAQGLAGQDTFNPLQAGLWGLARSFALEHPQRWAGIIDLDPDRSTASLAALLLAGDGEDQVAARDNQRFVCRMVPVAPPASPPPAFDPAGRYLVTGGLGYVGLSMAAWLVEHGARTISLVGRRALPARATWDSGEHPAWVSHAITTLRALESRGAQVETVALDLADRAAVQGWLENCTLSGAPLRGIIHAAGVMHPRECRELTAADVRSAMAGKVAGAWNLHQLTGGMALDLWLGCSSVSGAWGLAGNAAYAAANALLDGLALARRAQGLAALSIGWGAWEGGGMAGGAAADFNKLGMRMVSPAIAHAAADRLLASGAAHALVVRADWETLAGAYAAKARRPIFEALVGSAAPAPTRRSTLLRQRMDGMGQQERREYVLHAVERWVMETLGFTTPPGRDVGFFDLGMDSLMAVELRRRVEADLGESLSSTLTFDYPSINSLAQHLLAEVIDASAAAPAAHQAAPRSDEPIAVIGMACRLPGGADSPEALWELLWSGGSGVVPVPPERWNVADYYDADPDAPGKTYVWSAAFVDGIDRFDAGFFNITPREANNIDPQHRLLLELSWEALERAGIAPTHLKGSQTGVFVGITTNDYASLYQDSGAIDAYYSIGNSLNAAAGRISYVLGLRGPSMAIDTACSSSLVALHLACRSLLDGECAQALVGGVNAILSPTPMIALAKFRALAPDGRCKTFDDSADGYGRGEGAGMLVLKRLSDAQAAGDPILALVRGTAVSQDGASSGLTVPNGPAQEAVIRQALAAAGVQPREVQCVEAHGTGTPLGDPIEVHALGAVLKEGRPAGERVVLSSIKSNIGHLESAAGVAGVIKLILALRHGVIPPQANLTRPNRQIDWANLPFELAASAQPWPQGAQRIAGISSFGFSGTLAHAILEGPPVPPQVIDDEQRPWHVLTLSAKTAEALAELAGRVRHMLAHAPADLADLAYTFNTGRAQFAHRLAVAGAGASVALEALSALAAGQAQPNLRSGYVDEQRERPRITLACGDLSAAQGDYGRLLARTSPLARRLVARHEAGIAAALGEPLVGWLDGADWRGGSAAQAQASLYITQTTLVDLLADWGVAADAVWAEGSGLYAAAYAAGILSLADGLQLAVAYGRLLDTLGEHPGALRRWPESFSPSAMPRIEAALRDYRAAFQNVTLGEMRRPLLNQPADGSWQQPAAWVRAIRQPAAPAPDHGGAGLALTPLTSSASAWEELRGGEWQSICAALAGLYVQGVAIDWAAFDRGYTRRRRPDLPTYPFARQRFWVGPARAAAPAPRPGHWLLGQRLRLAPSNTICYEQQYSIAHPPIVNEHRIFGVQTVAGASHVSLMLSAALEGLKFSQCRVSSIVFLRPLLVADDETRTVQVVLRAQDDQYEIGVHSTPAAEDADWTLHSTGVVSGLAGSSGPLTGLAELRSRIDHHVSGADFYTDFWSRDYHLGTSFRWLADLWRHGNEGLGRLLMPAIADRVEEYALYPGLIDSCLQVMDYCLGGIASLDFNDALYVPFALKEVRFYGRPHGELWSHVRVEPGEDLERFIGTITLFNSAGEVFARFEGFEARRLTRQQLLQALHPSPAGQLAYVLDWPALPPAPPATPAGAWALCTNQPAALAGLAADLRALGATVHVIDAGASGGLSPDACAAALAQAAGGPTLEIVYAWLPEPAGPAGVQRAGMLGLLNLSSALLRHPLAASPRLWALTWGGGMPAAQQDSLDQSLITGLCRTIAQEHAAFWGGQIDLAPGAAVRSDELLAAMAAAEPVISLRGGVMHGARVQPHRPAGPVAAIRADRSYLITGGLGGVGLAVAEWLISQGARAIILSGRRAPTDGVALRIAHWRAAGVRLLAAQSDIAQAEQVESLFAQIADTMPPLAGVIHAAAVFDDALLINQTADRFAAVLDPKVDGAWWLHQQTSGMALDFFVLFSSLSSVLGSPGQSNYGAANAFLDALAHWRRAQGLPAQSISWGPWADIGAAAAKGAAQAEHWQRRGIIMMAPEAALRAFQAVLGGSASHLIIAQIDWPALAASLPGRDRVLLEALPTLRAAPSVAAPALAATLRGASPAEGREQLRGLVRWAILDVLGFGPDYPLADDQRLFEIGIDSLMAIETRERLANALGQALPATMLFDYPSIAGITTFIWRDVLERTDDEAAAPASAAADSIAHLSDQEIEALLLAKLDSLAPGREPRHDR